MHESEAKPLQLVVMGASGRDGLRGLVAFLAALPFDFDAAVLAVLHRASDGPSELKAVLARFSGIPVLLAHEGEHLHPGCCYIGRPDAHLSIGIEGHVRLVHGANNKYRNRTVDVLFHSVAEFAAPRSTAVILAGSLDDGSRGLAAIALKGGRTIVLGSDGCPDAGMPRSAWQADSSVEVLNSEDIVREIIRQVRADSIRAAVGRIS